MSTMKLGLLWGKVISILSPGAAKTSTYTSASIDLSPYKFVKVTVDSAQGTSATTDLLTPSFTESLVTGSGFAATSYTPTWVLGSDMKTVVTTITGTGGTYAGPICCIIETRFFLQFLKLVLTISGAGSPSFLVGSATFEGLEAYPS